MFGEGVKESRLMLFSKQNFSYLSYQKIFVIIKKGKAYEK